MFATPLNRSTKYQNNNQHCHNLSTLQVDIIYVVRLRRGHLRADFQYTATRMMYAALLTCRISGGATPGLARSNELAEEPLSWLASSIPPGWLNFR